MLKKQLFLTAFLVIALIGSCKEKEEKHNPLPKTVKQEEVVKEVAFDTTDYNTRIEALKNGDTSVHWKLKTPYPLKGALLPYKRIVAFYGNLYSKRMGILGELPKDEMLKKLQEEVANWQRADSTTEAIPALHYIAVTAQSQPGKNNKYRLRMPFKQIDTVISWANEINALVFLDVQIGHSTIKEEVSTLTDYLKLPNVHLGIDPEFAMKDGRIPGSKIGTLSADEINDAIDLLSKIVKENNLPPKILVVHRFNKGMITDYKNIKTTPEVQIVIDMDGFGPQAVKKSSFYLAVYKEPVQFVGFKLFYKNDNANGASMFTPEEVLQFKPRPIYIQYQ